MKTILSCSLVTILVLCACSKKEEDFGASGAFEAEETIISSEASGTIKAFDIVEGQELRAGQRIGFIDTIQLYLKKEQLKAQVKSILVNKPNVSAQLAALQEQLKGAEREQKRFASLVKADAATQKQLDDATTQVDVLRKQIAAQQSSLGISTAGITEQTIPVELQIRQLNDQLAKCYIINPVKGIVLSKYVEANEMAAPGKPLYKIADMSSITLRAYITGDQLAKIKLNQVVKVMTDDGNKGYKTYDGKITWISDKAEFTPKTIRTKDERANLVYAIKVKVKNDGYLKIGMYGQLKLQ
ncbi:MAG: HlyD family efflux transporter periplasmic adaptor subunit [Bacteroidetes bacterium]|jgi:HlyD family secretion protein|nr:HlyD family efflux transporter periplasmic adaptor subunit [Bacteroidota bacterium]